MIELPTGRIRHAARAASIESRPARTPLSRPGEDGRSDRGAISGCRAARRRSQPALQIDRRERGQEEVAQPDDLEAGLLELGPEHLLIVAARALHGLVVRAAQDLEGAVGHQDQAARLQHAVGFAQHLDVVGDVLVIEDVEKGDEIEAAPTGRGGPDVRPGQPDQPPPAAESQRVRERDRSRRPRPACPAPS